MIASTVQYGDRQNDDCRYGRKDFEPKVHPELPRAADVPSRPDSSQTGTVTLQGLTRQTFRDFRPASGTLSVPREIRPKPTHTVRAREMTRVCLPKVTRRFGSAGDYIWRIMTKTELTSR